MTTRVQSQSHLPLQSLHCGRLSHVAHVHSHLEALVESLSMEKQYDLSFKHPADSGIHLWTHHHHSLK